MIVCRSVRPPTPSLAAGACSLALCLSLLAASGQAQVPPESTYDQVKQTLTLDALRLEGEVGTYSEVYGISGRDRRRPAQSGRLFFRPTLYLPGGFTVAVDFLLSTEGVSSQQQINQLDINPYWRWGGLHLGDFTETYSSLTLDGIKIRGAGVSLSPGPFQLGFVTGRIQEERSASFGRSTFQRNLVGGQVGLGTADGSNLAFVLLKAEDKLPGPSTGLAVVDTAASDSVLTGETVTPQENLVVALRGQVQAASGKITWKNEVSASAFSRDVRAAKMEVKEIPGAVSGLFTPRTSSRADYAYTSAVNLRLQKVSIGTHYKLIGPGYTSLGLASQVQDRQEWGGKVAFALTRGTRVRLEGVHQNDNTARQKIATTNRDRWAANFGFRPRPWWSFGLDSGYQTMNNGRVATTPIDYANYNLASNHTFNLAPSSPVQTVTVGYAYQGSRDRARQQSGSDMDSHTVTLLSVMKLSEALKLSPSYMQRRTRAGGQGWVRVSDYKIGLGHKPSPKLTTALTVAYSSRNGDSAHSVRATLSSIYQVTPRLRLELGVATLSNRAGDEEGDFEESTAHVALTQRL